MILGTCDAAKAAACNRTARSAIVTALLGRLGGLFRRSIDILDTYYGIKQFSNALDAAQRDVGALLFGGRMRRAGFGRAAARPPAPRGRLFGRPRQRALGL